MEADRIAETISLTDAGVAALATAKSLAGLAAAEAWTLGPTFEQGLAPVRKACAKLPSALLDIDTELARVMELEPVPIDQMPLRARVEKLVEALAGVGPELDGTELGSSLSFHAAVLTSFLVNVQETPDVAGVRKLLDRKITIMKADAETEERYTLGVVLEPNDGENGAPLDPDTQNHIYSAADIRTTAHAFMESFRNIGLMHEKIVNKSVRILESYIAPVDFEMNGQKVRKGTWLLALRILSDDLWDLVKKGKITGYSIGGDAVLTPVV